ncbi:hypothetical protein [Tahibacter amnicola]|uniref:Uncharacterized protein n=1 Tax=Tahibacter amnicola TaxID=2976241 RepID=A0ABY6BHX2_9GAMM|nr:hypothetical protein [Tahibacter amnicola]UXI69450.1 hypothetical protein N4264_07320 [Tahibacter amnicola]
MRGHKNLVVVGLSDEDTAHLRLLMRKAGDDLHHRWRWGTEEGSDLVIVDPSVFAGQMARSRSLAAGLRVALVVGQKPADVGRELIMYRPLRLENVVEVLNQAGGDLVAPPPIDMGHPVLFDEPASGATIIDDSDYFTRMLEEEATGHHLKPRSTEPPAVGVDELFKRDEAAHKPQFNVTVTLDDDTLIEGFRATPSKRAESRMSDQPEAMARRSSAPGPNMTVPSRRSPDTGRHAMRTYLDGNLLGGPSQIKLDQVPALTLDPKHSEFYTSATSAQLQPYFRQPLAVAEWRALTTAEFGQVRETLKPQSCRRLTWLDVLFNSEGRLSPQLDPGGSYRLRGHGDMAEDIPNHRKICDALQVSAPLNQIAQTAGASMAEVFSMVSAYHAIGMIECTPRASLRTAPKTPESKPNLLSRLKRPFGKS